jgi:large subunit ribosomal protein LP0
MSEAGAARRLRKEGFAARLREYLDTYKNVLIVQVDNVGSNQMQKVRLALRGKAAVLMGKNTLVRNTIRKHINEGKNTNLENLLPLVYGNMGFVFTNGNLKEIRDIVLANKVPAAAKTGSFAPQDVHVPAGPTGMDPGQTAFFQALNIATKIVKGAIEIVNPVHLIKAGEKVTLSHVTLLAKLNILPFFYGFKVSDVYEDGTVYASDILDMSQETLLAKFTGGIQKIAAISLAISYPTLASLPFIVSGGFSKLLAISLATDYEFEQSKKFKEALANPQAFAAAAAPVAAAAPASAAAAKKEEKPAAKAEESDEDIGGGFSMFD